MRPSVLFLIFVFSCFCDVCVCLCLCPCVFLGTSKKNDAACCFHNEQGASATSAVVSSIAGIRRCWSTFDSMHDCMRAGRLIFRFRPYRPLSRMCWWRSSHTLVSGTALCASRNKRRVSGERTTNPSVSAMHMMSLGSACACHGIAFRSWAMSELCGARRSAHAKVCASSCRVTQASVASARSGESASTVFSGQED